MLDGLSLVALLEFGFPFGNPGEIGLSAGPGEGLAAPGFGVFLIPADVGSWLPCCQTGLRVT